MFDDPLIVFHGDKDKTAGRQMLDNVADPDSFSTRIRRNADGSATRLRTKGGMPQSTTIEKAAEPVAAVSVKTGWVETDFNKREYGEPFITRLSDAMGGFLALVKPITSINIDGASEGNFDFKPYPKVETNLP